MEIRASLPPLLEKPMSVSLSNRPETRSVTLTMRALHRLDGALRFRRHPLRNPVPILTLAFDDIPDTAASVGAPILEAAGVRGTFYVSSGLLGREAALWRHADEAAVAGLAARGHEIGLHSHAHVPVAHLGLRGFSQDLVRARAELARLLPGARLDNYALPFGFAAPHHRPCLARRTRSCRTTHPGINAGTADPYRILSHSLGEGRRHDGYITALLDQAAAATGWLILTIHDVGPQPTPYGCTGAALSTAIAGARARGMEILTMSDALDRCGLPPRVPG